MSGQKKARKQQFQLEKIYFFNAKLLTSAIKLHILILMSAIKLYLSGNNTRRFAEKLGNTFFQKRVKDLRNDKGVTMEQLAEIIGVTKSRVNMWENNGTIPREEALLKLSEYFNVSTDYLLGNDERDGKSPKRPKLNYLQRNLSKLDDRQLETAENMLRAVFADVFNKKKEV